MDTFNISDLKILTIKDCLLTTITTKIAVDMDLWTNPGWTFIVLITHVGVRANNIIGYLPIMNTDPKKWKIGTSVY